MGLWVTWLELEQTESSVHTSVGQAKIVACHDTCVQARYKTVSHSKCFLSVGGRN